MIEVIIFGNGNVATQLAKAFFKAKNIRLVQVYSRSKPNEFFIKNKIDTTNNLNKVKQAAIYIIAISDDAIATFSKKLNFTNKLIVHTSGSKSINELNCNARKGIFYPLQSISKNKKISFKNIPICLEAENKSDYLLLEKLALSISKKVYPINSEQRKSLHVAAVFVNNFTNHLYKIGKDICDTHQVDFDILKPLIVETAKKIKHLTPQEAQTGPAVRGDKKTIENHLKLLDKKQREIYTLITESIIESKRPKTEN